MTTFNRNKLVCQKMEDLLETIKEANEDNTWKRGQLYCIIEILEDEMDDIELKGVEG